MYIDIRYKYIVNIYIYTYIFANIINDTVIGSGRDNKLCKHSFVQVCQPKEQVTTCGLTYFNVLLRPIGCIPWLNG
jgi:hypothetical protein